MWKRRKVGIGWDQGVTKISRLSWLTNSALVYEPKRGGVGGGLANEYSCAHGAQLNFGDLTPYLTYRCDLYPVLLFLCMNSCVFSRVRSGSGSWSEEDSLVDQMMGQERSSCGHRHKWISPERRGLRRFWAAAKPISRICPCYKQFPSTPWFCSSRIRQTTCI